MLANHGGIVEGGPTIFPGRRTTGRGGPGGGMPQLQMARVASDALKFYLIGTSRYPVTRDSPSTAQSHSMSIKEQRVKTILYCM